jgi:hypothetical protein
MDDPQLAHVRKFARVLDDYGLDPLLGFLLPGVGDVLGSLLGLYIVAIAVRRGVSKVTIARMLMNLGIDAAVGVVPILGDIADVMWKANDKNLALLERRRGGMASATDWAMLIGAIVAFVGVIALVCYALVRLVRAIG